jgi:peptidoglycan biosynthesis protein MviN/MurJ (putative lipid II flippase)
MDPRMGDTKEILDDISPPQNSPVAAVITALFLIGGVYYSTQGVYRVLPLAISLSLVTLAFDGTWYLNNRLKDEQKVEADYFISYIVSGILVFMGLLLSRQLHWYQIDAPFFSDFTTALVGSFALSALYIIVLTLLMRRGVLSIVVQKDPANPADRFYVYTEEQYIKELEQHSLEKAKSNND